MVKRSLLRRASYVGSALVLMLAMVPIMPNNNAWADEGPCISSDSNSNLNNAVSKNDADVELTLCANNSFENYPYGLGSIKATNSFKLNLNGNTLKLSVINVPSGVDVTIYNGTILHGSSDQLIRNDGSGTLTLKNIIYNNTNNSRAFIRMLNGSTGKVYIKSGNYSGIGDLFSKQSDTASIIISGGTFSQNVSAYVAVGYASYKNGNSWVVEPKLTLSDVEFPSSIEMYEGEIIADLKDRISVLNGSQTSFVFALDINSGNLTEEEKNEKRSMAEVNHDTGRMKAKKYGTVNVIMASTFEPSVRKSIPVTIKSGLVGINIDDISLLQEGTVRKDITNIYADAADPEFVTNVSYAVDESSLVDGLEARISTAGDQLVVTTGEDAKIEAGNYMIRVKAYRDGVYTGVYKDVMVAVNELFTDFGLNEVDGTGKIILKENDYHKNLTISGAATVNSLDDVKIKSVNLLNGNNVMRISSKNRLTGNNSGVGNAEISVTAEYESPKGNVYTLTKNFPAKVTSVFESMTINGGDLFHIFEVYGLGQGEISEVSINKNSTRSFRIMKNLQSAGVDYEVVSDNEAVEVELNQLTGNFTIRGKNVGEANIIVTVTPKNAENNEGAVTNSFKVVVNPILENITASDLEIDQGDFGQIVATANDGLTPTYFYIETTRGGNILSIDSDGSFSAIAGKHGVATVNIIAIDPNARIVSKTINVKVNAVLNLITLKEDEITVYEGDTAEIEIDSVVDGSIRDQVTWSYTGYDHSIIGMGGTNKITPRRDGVTTVTVTGTFVSPLGKIYTAKATVNVVVKSKLESITVEDINVKVGERADINITVDANDITPRYTYGYSDNTIARNSRSGGVRALKAGDTELTVTARHFGKTVTATAMVHVYEMEAPEHHHYYGATGEVFEVHVGDKNANAYTVARVDKMGMMVMGDRAVAFMPGVYTVTYTDYMANGEKVGEYTAEFTVFRVERETVVVARGETKYLDGHSEWDTTSAKDETTGHHVHVNRNGKVVFATDQETALGVHEVTMKHSFGRDAREIVKRVTVVVYEVTADSETDPEGITADTLKDYIEGMFAQPTSWEEMIAKMQQAQDLFGTGFESVWSAMGVSGAVMNGSEIATRVEVTELEEVDVDENLISAVEALNVDNVEYYDVSVWMSRDGYDFGRLHQLNNKITVALTTVTDPESGYARKYIVVRQHEGEEPEVLVEGVDFYIEDSVLYVISDKFSTFAVAYQDTMIPAYGSVTYTVKAPETGESTIEGFSANDNSMIMTIVAMIAVITVAGVAVFTKRR